MKFFLTSNKFLRHLKDIGAIPDIPYQKVIIEADCNAVVKIYLQTIGTDKLLQVQFVDPPMIVSVKDDSAKLS